MIIVGIIPLVSCGGGASGAGQALQSKTELENLAAQFEGIEGIEPIDYSSFLITWSPLPTDSPISYGVYRGPTEGEIEYEIAYAVIDSDGSMIYNPEEVFSDSPECFAVRVSNVAGDLNEATSCIAARPFEFSGITGIEPKSDGAYLLKWNAIPLDGVTYSVFQRDINGDYDFTKPPSIAGVSKNFEQTDIIPRGTQLCFLVRHNDHIKITDADANTAEECTSFVEPLVFDGIKDLVALNANEVRVAWDPGDSTDIISYRIYSGSEFDEVVQVVDADKSEAIIGDRNAGVRYVFGVKAVDLQGREDNNVEIIPIQMPAE